MGSAIPAVCDILCHGVCPHPLALGREHMACPPHASLPAGVPRIFAGSRPLPQGLRLEDLPTQPDAPSVVQHEGEQGTGQCSCTGSRLPPVEELRTLVAHMQTCRINISVRAVR